MCERALELFDWFGSGAGPWTGFPDYELLPEQILLRCLLRNSWPPWRTLDSRPNNSKVQRAFAGWAFASSASSPRVPPPHWSTAIYLVFVPEYTGAPVAIPASLRGSY
ncbi:MAG: hypothetical protein R3C10_18730 [Pirellulales bacterium]